MDVVERVHRSLDERPTPEAVCGLILEMIGPRLMPFQRRILERAARSRPARYSSMSDDFERPVPMHHKVEVLAALTGRPVTPAMRAIASDPWKLEREMRLLGQFVGWNPDSGYAGRLNRQQRAVGGYELSRRRYNRLVRQMIRTERRLRGMQQQILLAQMVRVGRSGLAYSITVDDVRADPDAAAFVAYWVAQRNRRREFSLDGKADPFDPIAEMLFERLLRAKSVDWWMVARAYPAQAVLERLLPERLGELLGEWFTFMQLGADILERLFEAWPVRNIEPNLPDAVWASRPGLMPSREARGARQEKLVDRATMVVRRGVDSSTWNTAAQAYNAARAGWIGCLAAAGQLGMLEVMCPPKAMRLMAADLVAWNNGQAHPDVAVAAQLPWPWEVFSGHDPCDDGRVDVACRQVGVDPETTGWLAPRQTGATGRWEPTPELVHGVEVSSPLWAGLLRAAGAFSGKQVTDPDVLGAYVAERQQHAGDAHGWA